MTRMDKKIKEKFFVLLIAGIFMMSGLYVYFVNTAVFEIVDKKQNLRQLQEFGIEHQRLEEYYFETLGQFNPEYAFSLGFVAQSQNNIAVRQTSMARR